MKLKLEDLTLKQIGDICENNDTCEKCPLCEKEHDSCYYGPIAPYHIHISNYYKKEIEIDDNLLKDLNKNDIIVL